MIEILKYSSKIFTSPDVVQKKRRTKDQVIICIDAYDNIISAMKGRRIFERFGFDLPPRKKKESRVKMLKNYKEWFYLSEFND